MIRMESDATKRAEASFVELLKCSTTLEGQELSDGTLLIGKLPARPDGIFQDAYLHEIYAPLGSSDIGVLERTIGRTLPKPLADFYMSANGLSIFCGSLSIRGFRPNMSRADAARHPTSLSYGNKVEIPIGQDESERIVFGFYADGDGYEVSILPDQGDVVVLTPRRSTEPLKLWDSLSAFLKEEIQRMTKEFVKREGVCDPLNVLPVPVTVPGSLSGRP